MTKNDFEGGGLRKSRRSRANEVNYLMSSFSVLVPWAAILAVGCIAARPCVHVCVYKDRVKFSCV